MKSDGIVKAELRLTQKSQASLPVCLASPLLPSMAPEASVLSPQGLPRALQKAP